METLKIHYDRYKGAPRAVQGFCFGQGAWVVGSAAQYLLGLRSECRDWDLQVPFERWYEAIPHVPDTAVRNTFGGWKYQLPEGVELDLWPGTLQHLLTHAHQYPQYAVHPGTWTWVHAHQGLQK
jgi:hypothetical protein